VELDRTTTPRQTGVRADSLNKTGSFLLRKKGYKPNLDAFSIWFLRHQNLEVILPQDRIDITLNVKELREYTLASFGLIEAEVDTLFDSSEEFITKYLDVNGGELFQNQVADAANYLPLPDYRTKQFERPATSQKLVFNLVVYGAPGTGKSWLLEEQAQEHFAGRYTRVTFYPDYSFAQFVGGYRPKSQYLDEQTQTYYPVNAPGPQPGTYARRPIIDYVAVPGPLLNLLVRAYRDPDHTYLLLVEELNRANAAAVFGDLFQLLDRDAATGHSTYAVALPEELGLWLRTQQLPDTTAALVQTDPASGEVSIRLPNNFYVWATMNSADQGVQPLDAAFKRRWAFEYVPLNQYQGAVEGWTMRLLGRPVSWNQLRQRLNRYLMRQASGGGRALVPEDRLLGPFFMSQAELTDNLAVLNKLLLYLRDDLARHNPGLLFAPGCLHFSELYEEYLKRSDAVGNDGPDTAESFAADLKAIFSAGLAAELASLFQSEAAPAPADHA